MLGKTGLYIIIRVTRYTWQLVDMKKVHFEDNSEALSVAFIEVTDNLNSSLFILIE